MSGAFSPDNMLRPDFFLIFTWMFSFHLIASEALRQDPVVDVIEATWERPVDGCRASLLDSFCDNFRVDAVSE